MSLQIKRTNDSRVVKSILHRVADVPGGVTVSIADLGGTSLVEGTPIIAPDVNGLCKVVKTGKVATAYTSGTSLEIAKGSHFKVGDKIANEAGTMAATITAIDKTAAAKDVVTLAAGFSSTLAVNDKIILVTVTTNAAVGHGAVAYGAFATTTVTEFKVDKGHTLAVGDYVAGTTMTGKAITNINRGNDDYDVITVGAQIGAALADNEVLTVVTASNGSTAKTFAVADTITKQAVPFAIVGSNYDVVAGDNLFVDAWLQAVVLEANGPVVTAAIKTALKGIIYL